ncbi:unnamed protein product [Notodromas monacha]|uniref:Uncharacterized protein n=1 Tax=Notodromas monacha TaxID=399045 RepID=A0A7R9BT56_9CRUS|nr:unnamed protein product [Notodromas monacha]CAG0921279.1 unnamed protein product [Notodromas monacha]
MYVWEECEEILCLVAPPLDPDTKILNNAAILAYPFLRLKQRLLFSTQSSSIQAPSETLTNMFYSPLSGDIYLTANCPDGSFLFLYSGPVDDQCPASFLSVPHVPGNPRPSSPSADRLVPSRLNTTEGYSAGNPSSGFNHVGSEMSKKCLEMSVKLGEALGLEPPTRPILKFSPQRSPKPTRKEWLNALSPSGHTQQEEPVVVNFQRAMEAYEAKFCDWDPIRPHRFSGLSKNGRWVFVSSVAPSNLDAEWFPNAGEGNKGKLLDLKYLTDGSALVGFDVCNGSLAKFDLERKTRSSVGVLEGFMGCKDVVVCPHPSNGQLIACGAEKNVAGKLTCKLYLLDLRSAKPAIIVQEESKLNYATCSRKNAKAFMGFSDEMETGLVSPTEEVLKMFDFRVPTRRSQTIVHGMGRITGVKFLRGIMTCNSLLSSAGGVSLFNLSSGEKLKTFESPHLVASMYVSEECEEILCLVAPPLDPDTKILNNAAILAYPSLRLKQRLLFSTQSSSSQALSETLTDMFYSPLSGDIILTANCPDGSLLFLYSGPVDGEKSFSDFAKHKNSSNLQSSRRSSVSLRNPSPVPFSSFSWCR